jgi:tripartite-type tricarboxylate transporter receptor subunit TctC
LSVSMAGLCVAVAAVTSTATSTAWAQEPFPSRPLRMVVPWPPSGPPDLMARLLAPKITEAWGRAVVVENRAGATGTIGTDLVAKSAPDGYTLLLTSNQPLVIAPALIKTAYDPLRDLHPVGLLTEDVIMLVVNSSLGVNSVAEFIALAKARPGALAYGTAGIGSMGHLGAELIKMVTGIDILHVPYPGVAQAATAVVSGEVMVGFPPVLQIAPHVKAGKLRALGVTGTRPSPFMPEVQPLVSQGLNGVVVVSWMSALVPPKTPRAVTTAWRDVLVKALQDPGVRQKLDDAGIQTQWQEAEQASAAMETDLAKWRKVVSVAKITAN